MLFLEWIKDYLAPVLSLLLSSFAFGFTFKNEWSKKFNIDVEFLDERVSEYLVDRDSNTSPDVYYQNRFRLIPMVCITNNSSYPVTINELKLNDKYKFAFFTHVGDLYEITVESSVKKVGAMTIHTAGNIKKFRIDDVHKNMLKPPFTIQPYQSLTGVIFFTYNSSVIGQNTLTVKTSRGIKEFEINVVTQSISRKISDYIPPRQD